MMRFVGIMLVTHPADQVFRSWGPRVAFRILSFGARCAMARLMCGSRLVAKLRLFWCRMAA